MTLSSPKQFYTRFLAGHEGKLHFAAHSHHFWPDVTRQAQLDYWDDSSRLSDEKWNKIFGEVIPKTQRIIASILNLSAPEQIVLAPNTHELTARLLSLFLGKNKLHILTTTSEFHSWRRQFLRLSELSGVRVDQVSTENYLHKKEQFLDSFIQGLKTKPDIAFISQVFFDSGMALTDEELKTLLDASTPETLFVIDGYHGFAALPTSLRSMEGRVFYLGGGYKYAQGGEGVGFMVVPKGVWRPAYTGWFAEYSTLSMPPGAVVGYAPDAMAFMGATQDPSGFYRFNAAWEMLTQKGFSVDVIHELVKKLQLDFLAQLPGDFTQRWNLQKLFHEKLDWHGHFLTFLAPDVSTAEKLQRELKELGILIDRRERRLRFGFAPYQDHQDISELCRKLKN
jgi:selenocysteine lyase/cysteine desulfurase